MPKYDYNAYSPGAVFRGLTLKQKGRVDEFTGKLYHGEWLMTCVCGDDVFLKRAKVIIGERATCGKCEASKFHQKIAKKESANELEREHLNLAGFKNVETRKHISGAVWWVWRESASKAASA